MRPTNGISQFLENNCNLQKKMTPKLDSKGKLRAIETPTLVALNDIGAQQSEPM